MLTAVLVVCALSVYGHTDFPLDMSDDDFDSEEPGNETDVLGEYVGGPCEDTCKETLSHVVCNKKTQICECEPGFPVRLGAGYGCAKPVNLGEQCFYYQACMYTDQNADCVQIKHNAICQCKEGYHLATVQKPMKRVFCSQDLVVIATNLSTLFGIATGLAIFTALICFVLKLFSGSRPRHYANTNLAPPIIFAQSGKKQQSESKNWPSLCSLYNPTEITNYRSYASVHSSTSSTKSFSARQYERERENRLLAKARERERGDGGSTSPRSLENLIDGPLPSESWPHLEEVSKSKAFSPEMLDDPPDIPFPDIDQMDGFENPFTVQLEQMRGIEKPLGRQGADRTEGQQLMDPLRLERLVKATEPLGQQPVRSVDVSGQQAVRSSDPFSVQSTPPTTDSLVHHSPRSTDRRVQGHGIENPLAPKSDPSSGT